MKMTTKISGFFDQVRAANHVAKAVENGVQANEVDLAKLGLNAEMMKFRRH